MITFIRTCLEYMKNGSRLIEAGKIVMQYRSDLLWEKTYFNIVFLVSEFVAYSGAHKKVYDYCFMKQKYLL